MKAQLYLMPSVLPHWQTAVLPALQPWVVAHRVADWDELTILLGRNSVALVAFGPEDDIDLMALEALAKRQSLVCALWVSRQPAPVPWPEALIGDVVDLDADPGVISQRVITLARLIESHLTTDRLIHRDDVTELVNRRYFTQRLQEEAALSSRHKHPMALILVAVQSFPFYLDAYGYEATHAFLRQVMSRIVALVRQEDTVARLGDNEIGILMPRATEQAAQGLLQRLYSKLTQAPLAVAPEELEEDSLRLVAGIVSWPVPDDPSQPTPELLLRYGRHALHAAIRQAQTDLAEIPNMLDTIETSTVDDTTHPQAPMPVVLTHCSFSALRLKMDEGE